jgi:hypothetical protein
VSSLARWHVENRSLSAGYSREDEQAYPETPFSRF